MNLRKYFISMGLLNAFVLGSSTFAHLYSRSSLVNPSLGGVLNPILRISLFIAVGLTSAVPLLFQRRRFLKRMSLTAVGVCVAFLVLYALVIERNGRSDRIAARDISFFIVAGSQRTPFAQLYFAGIEDIQMLEMRGWGEEDLALYWTADSLRTARVEVLITYVGVFAALNLFVGSVVAGVLLKSSKRLALGRH